MAVTVPPPPTKSEPGSFAWMDWYRNLYAFLNQAITITWAQIDKSTSSLADITTRPHSALQSILGTGEYHLSANEQARASVSLFLQSQATDPTTGDIPTSNWAIYKNTTSGLVKLWVNDAGTMRSVTIT